MRQLKISKQITNRDTYSLDKYLQEIAKEELLTPEQEVELARRIKEGDEEALERLVKANLRFVVSVAKQYQNQGLSLQDLINEGNLGLIKAAQRFDETRGFKFISYAVWWIRQSILQALAENARLIRLPLNRVGTMNKISKVYAELEQNFEREPTAKEIAEALEGLSEKDVKSAMRYFGRHLSVNAPLQEGEDGTLLDLLPNENTPRPDERLIQENLKEEIEALLKTLSAMEAEVIRLYYGIGQRHALTLEEIAQRFQLSRERIRQIKEKALLKIKNHKRAKELRRFLA